MQDSVLNLDASGRLPVTRVQTLVIGSGAAGLNAAVQLRRQGVDDVLILSEGLRMGTSINTGSDKQTYYKLALCGETPDSPRAMAEALFSPGGMHGDLALAEAAGSVRAFFHLVGLGVDFPRDAYGQFVGYKTDHDPSRRGTSTGPHTSRDLCLALLAEVRRLDLPVRERHSVVRLLTTGAVGGRRVCGALALDAAGEPVAFAAENVVFAVGGPGGLYHSSVYPAVQTGAIGLGLMAGARAQGLPESQYGLASIRFRWNVSGTYWQAVPRVVSTASDGESDPREFLRDCFPGPGPLFDNIFLKGYQWPFDAAKVVGGSSLLDLLVHRETVERNRRVFLDYRTDPDGFQLGALGEEARRYLEQCGASQRTPFERLRHMNPDAAELYRKHGIDLARDRLEIAVCAQHNNGGLAANRWWESVNLRHLFPVGEVNGSHGVARPGGSALNAGQVGALRAAEYIAHVYSGRTCPWRDFRLAARDALVDLRGFLARCARSDLDGPTCRAEFQRRMSKHGAAFRSVEGLRAAVREAREQVDRLEQDGCRADGVVQRVRALQSRQLCFAHWVYLEAALFHAESGVGSRGSVLLRNPSGLSAHPLLDPAEWNFVPENTTFRERVQETELVRGRIVHRWVARRPIPVSDPWFETAWAEYRSGALYR